MMRNLVIVAIALGGLALAQEPVVRITPEQVAWVRDTDGSGVERATISGDPTKPGLYVLQIKFPPGTMSLNHFHPEDRHVIVLKGTWYTGTGDEFLPDKTVPLKPGSYMKHPAGVHHFDGAKDEEVILQIVGVGPTGTTRLRPEQGNYRKVLEDPARAELDRTAKKHIDGICSTCHTAALITETQATREEWLDIVNRMNSKGAGLSEIDVQQFTDYLSRNYGKKP